MDLRDVLETGGFPEWDLKRHTRTSRNTDAFGAQLRRGRGGYGSGQRAWRGSAPQTGVGEAHTLARWTFVAPAKSKYLWLWTP